MKGGVGTVAVRAGDVVVAALSVVHAAGDKSSLTKLAMMANTGGSRAVRPQHTLDYGDEVNDSGACGAWGRGRTGIR